MDPLSLGLVIVLIAALVWVLRKRSPRVRIPVGPFGRLFCLAGFHDWRVTNVTLGFGQAGDVETVTCNRCGAQATRHHDRAEERAEERSKESDKDATPEPDGNDDNKDDDNDQKHKT
ncbi:MAG: hypothetical protein ACPGOV_13525 [Magnetovibrionaceae bacterium]